MRLGHRTVRGNTIILVVFILAGMIVATLGFFQRSATRLKTNNMYFDVETAKYAVESAHTRAIAKVDRALDGIDLAGRLQFVGGPAQETFNNLANTYAQNEASALEFLRDLIVSQAYSASGVLNSTHEFSNFSNAFPSNWTDPDTTDDEFFEYRFEFSASTPIISISPQQIEFEFSYRVDIRAYGRTNYTVQEASDRGSFSVSIAGRPFSQWVLLMHSMRNQNGSQLYFAGGNTSAQIQEVYGGPVHVNERPAFYGHPTFLDLFTSAAPEPWTYVSASGYTSCPSQCPTFANGKMGSLSPISLPSEIFNTLRLAAGDPSSTAATNNASVTTAELSGFLSYNATGVTTGATVPAEVYIPTDSSLSTPTGGIFVKGDAEIQLDVVQGESLVGASYWSNISASDRSCKFQKIRINHLTAGIATRDILIADDPCNSTYIFNADSPTSAPRVLSGRVNGNLHVEGKIDWLGGASRTRPSSRVGELREHDQRSRKISDSRFQRLRKLE